MSKLMCGLVLFCALAVFTVMAMGDCGQSCQISHQMYVGGLCKKYYYDTGGTDPANHANNLYNTVTSTQTLTQVQPPKVIYIKRCNQCSWPCTEVPTIASNLSDCYDINPQTDYTYQYTCAGEGFYY